MTFLTCLIGNRDEDMLLATLVKGISRSEKLERRLRWGKRKLAYPIEHFTDGNYVLTQFKLKPELSKELEASLRISEEVLRYLLIRLGSQE